MREWTKGMNNWSSGNSFLRHLNDEDRYENLLSMDTLLLPELLSVLDSIHKYVIATNSGKAKIRIHHGMINISIESSKEMLS